MIDSFPLLKNISFPSIERNQLKTLQLNLGYRCNLQCNHCHVGASPYRTEVMSENTLEDVITFVKKYQIKQVDLTGGAPELHPQFLYLVKQLSNLDCEVLLRSNLSVLQLPDYNYLMDE
ncbi:MAG: radical SAM protein, partial [Gammaproteobacteria bacterium]|nr:radical SAM protein [Gammaproteobacteria bacterium]